MSIKIILNIYDLTKLNKFLLLHAIGLGAYHTIFDTEFQFVPHDKNETGVVEESPAKLCPKITFRESIVLGESDLQLHQIQEVIEKLKKKYKGPTYNLITNNCNHFTNEFSQMILKKSIPNYINRLVKLSKPFQCILPKQPKIQMIQSQQNTQQTQPNQPQDEGGIEQNDNKDENKMMGRIFVKLHNQQKQQQQQSQRNNIMPSNNYIYDKKLNNRQQLQIQNNDFSFQLRREVTNHDVTAINISFLTNNDPEQQIPQNTFKQTDVQGREEEDDVEMEGEEVDEQQQKQQLDESPKIIGKRTPKNNTRNNNLIFSTDELLYEGNNNNIEKCQMIVKQQKESV